MYEVENTLAKMIEGGLPMAEITYRTAFAKEAIALAIEKFQINELYLNEKTKNDTVFMMCTQKVGH